MTHEIPWARVPGPPEYRPDDVVPALDAISTATDRQEAYRVGSQVMYTIGHDSSGVFWPAAVLVTPVLLDVVATRTGWPQVAPIDVLIDLHGTFVAAPGWETFIDGTGAVVDAQLALDLAGRAALPEVLRLAREVRGTRGFRDRVPRRWAVKLLDELAEVLADKQASAVGPSPAF